MAPMPPPVVAVAVSGGRDSLCLLHATLRAARTAGLRVLALHVHHGLVPEADAWAASLVRRVRGWARAGAPVEIRVLRLDGAPAPGDTVEAWARRERYAALAQAAREAGASLVLLGHHRRDQAETVLLQALRGAGPAGLAAMPRVAEREGLTWARPWLQAPREAVEAYARAHRLARAAVEDPSNADPRFDRSRLRHAVMPALREAFPQAEAALAAVAHQAADAKALLAEVATTDLVALGAGDALPHAAWRELSPARRANALRAWLAARLPGGVPDTLLQRLLTEWQGGSTGAWPAGPGAALRAWRGTLRVVGAAPSPDVPSAGGGRDASLSAPAPLSTLHITGPGEIALPGWDGSLRVSPTRARGLPATKAGWSVQVRARSGGEQFALAPRGTARALKKQYQAADVPAWRRAGPLLFAGDTLLFVPGLGVDARAWGAEGAEQWALAWEPHRG